VQINRSLSASESVVQLLQICDSSLDEFDNVNYVTALHRLARLGVASGAGERLCSRLVDHLNVKILELRVQQLANTVWSLARLLVWHQPIMSAIAGRVACCGEDFGPQECSNFSWACARMEWRDESMLGAIAGRSVQIVAEFLPQHLGNIAWSMAKMRNINEPLVSAIADRALFTIPHSEQQEISNLVQGFAKTSAKCTKPIEAL